MMNDRLIRACRGEPVEYTPIWLMRQAGRYLPEYQKLRERYSIPLMEMFKTPELAVEVTLQPVRRFELDAAIIFADLMTPIEGMGINLEIVKGKGPEIHNPVRTLSDVEKLNVPTPEESVPFTLEAIRLTHLELGDQLPLIGFAGAPFTLACYLIQGTSSHDYGVAKNLMHAESAVWHALMNKLSQVLERYLQAQVAAGADALQVFDSWAGVLSPLDYARYVLPYSNHVINAAKATGVPVIHFSTGTAGSLELIRDAGGDVISVDWRIPLDDAWHRIGPSHAIQGNLDPMAVCGPWPELKHQADDILRRAEGRPGHIFNLGHGLLPQTPVDNVARLVEFVHQWQYAGAEIA
jgi:uroporphyrinogen decarboxylase